MSLIRKLSVGFVLCAAGARGQSTTYEPHVGYLYPAGARQGTEVLVTAGGQFLRGAEAVFVSGRGVHASVLRYCKAFRNLNGDQSRLLRQRLGELWQRRLSPGGNRPAPSADEKATGGGRAGKSEPSGAGAAAKAPPVELPDHPLLHDLEHKDLGELAHVADYFFGRRSRQQFHRQLAEAVLLRIVVDPDAAPGRRELRIRTPRGLTNPLLFEVGLLPEVREREPNDGRPSPRIAGLRDLPKERVLDLPVLLNGQILPGDIDRFRFRARRGLRLVVRTRARRLIPYLADAVPGWFQAVVALYDAEGRELAFADDYRFDPDPVLLVRVPADGEYVLEIRDAIYRGREDFVYRIAVGGLPFITEVFPLGGREGTPAVTSIAGWNLRTSRLPLDTRPGGGRIRRTAYREGNLLSNPVAYAVDTLPECVEAEPNDIRADAQRIDLPRIIDGRIERSGDVDLFRIEGRAGEAVVAEVFARRLDSPLDALLRLTDAAGRVLAWNDDHVLQDGYLHKDLTGLLTHHADAYLMARIPADGTYHVQLADAQHHGGEAYAYRLRLSHPMPDFALRVTPASLGVRAGGIVPITVHVLREDGFDGAIEVALVDASSGFELHGGRIGAGRDRVRMTLTAPPEAPDRPVALHLEGRARVGGRAIRRPAVPAEDVMQAFLYRHLVPARELLVAVGKARWRVPPIALVGDGPVRIPAGGTAPVRIQTRRGSVLKAIRLELRDPPEGVTLRDVTVVRDGLAFRLAADKDTVEAGLADNLIVEALREFTPKAQKGKPVRRKRRASLGFLPAIPIEIVAR